MFLDVPQSLIYVAGGAFVLGWIVAKIGAFIGRKLSACKRDPRDDKIRSLEAELRVAHTDAEKAKRELEERNREIAEEQQNTVDLTATISNLHAKVGTLKADLKDSVKKTRELRNELSERATESLKSEVRLREAETELSVAHASTDMIATGVLDYSAAPGSDNDDNHLDATESEIFKSVSK